MAPFEALYGHKCRTPLNWVEPGERRYYGIDFVKEAEEQVLIIKKHMEAAQARQKSYADRRRKPLEFEVGDFVYLKVSPMKGVNRFGVKRKLAPMYVGPYQIIEKSGKVASKVQLPPELGAIFPIFMCLNSRSVFVCPKSELKPEVLSCSLIYPMKKSLCKFWMSRKELPEGG